MTNNGGSAQAHGDRPGRADTPAKRAVIIGAGIAGLATALRLHRSGWRVLVVERAPGRRSSGYLVNLPGQAYDTAGRLGILPQLVARDIGFFTSILTRADGSAKFTVPAAAAQALGSRMLTVFRGDLETVLYEEISEIVPIRFGTTVRAVVPGRDEVDIEFADGSRETADLLVGADGVHSVVRGLLFGEATDCRVELKHMVGALPLDGTPDGVPEGAGTTFIGVRRTAAVMNLGPGRSSAFFTYYSEDPETELKRGAVDALTTAFGDLEGGVPNALRQLARDPGAAYFDSVSQIVLNRWSSGRVLLLGDSAWCVTVFAGHGAALALTGADRLGDELDAHGDDIPAALAAWEAALRPEVRKRQALARKGTAQFAPPTKAHIFANEMMIRAMRLPGIRTMMQRAIARANE
ncbi:FAD-dependent oxidoreductase [Nocardia arthritidis]|uniref:FAD-dependent oxidoreductase n=1 Tax=Nocardia arthritidis TaxID=228602 RepID=UPI00142E6C1F|nr:FAD-dependent oxidoreductase [Nocardia arthritidis]